MQADNQAQIILRSDYLYNKKTGNGFVVLSKVFFKERIIDILPIHISDDLIYDVLNGGRGSLRSFQQISVEKRIPFTDKRAEIIAESFPTPIIAIPLEKIKGFFELTYKHRHPTIKRDRPTMPHALVTSNKELIGASKIIFEYSVITSYKSSGIKNSDFVSKTEMLFINNFEKLSEPEKEEYYRKLQSQMYALPG